MQAEAWVALALMLLSLLAFDDITTDNSVGFLPEYSFLAITAAWLLAFVVQLWRKGRSRLAGISLVALLVGAWVTADGLGHIRDGGWTVFWPEYSTILLVWLWFLGLALLLLVRVSRTPALGGPSMSQ